MKRIKSLMAALLVMLVGEPALAQDPSASAQTVSPDDILYLDLSTGGRVTIRMYPELAPKHVERIRELTREGFYDGVIFHRVIEGFMAQTGDPTGTGRGGSELPNLEPEFNATPHLRGTVSMARTADENGANSQFFIMFMPNFSLDGNYTVFGRVTEGIEYVDAIQRGQPPVSPDRIVQASLASQAKARPDFSALPPRTPPVPTAPVAEPEAAMAQ